MTINLADIWDKLGIVNLSGSEGKAGMRGPLNQGWMTAWSEDFRTSNFTGSGSDRYSNDDRAALLMTIYDRLRPGKLGQAPDTERYEMLRRAGRQFDASGAISAGQMLIFAKAEDSAPLPFAMKVEGTQVKGEGVVYYQVIVPMERVGAATQPMERESAIYDLGSAPAVESSPQPQQRPMQQPQGQPRFNPQRNRPGVPRNQNR